MASEAMDRKWDQIKAQIESMWGEMDEKRMKQARGSLTKMVALIKENTDEDERAIIAKMSALV